MSGATWFIGDLHFGHKKVAGLRGFESTLDHDMRIVAAWKKQVRDGDVVHVLGDLSGGSRSTELYALSVLSELPGRKRLIAGNHDSVASIHRRLSQLQQVFNSVFERVGDFGRVKVDGRQVLLSHYPYADDHVSEPRYMQYRLLDMGSPLIHAHTHSSERTKPGSHELCVSWEAWGRMVNLGDVAQWLKEVV